jgi:hypothetical protein
MIKIHVLSHYADICAIPLFLIAIHYFWKKPEWTHEEQLLFFFVCLGFILDSIFTINYLGY